MLIDYSLILAEGQKLTAAAAGANVVDLGQDSPTPGFSKKLELVCVVTADVTGTLQVKLQDSATKSGTYADVAASAVYSAPKAGTVITVPMPYSTKQFLKAYFGGSPTAGTVTAYLTEGRQMWDAAKQAESITKAPVQEKAA